MPDVIPFKGCRFDTRVVDELAKLIAPPYDVIDPALRDVLFRRSPCNIARITRANRIESAGANPYAAAAALWAQWRQRGVVKPDGQPALYVYEQFFERYGRRYSRTALIGAVRLENFGSGILPHEHTLSGPRLDRLELMRAARAQFGQVFGLYSDPAGAVAAIVEPAKKRRPLAQAADPDFLHRLWAISDPAAVAEIQKALRDKEILIADGHHRYETSLAYRDEHPELESAKFRMMALVELSSPGLLVLPIHRLVKGLKDFQPEAFLAGLRRAFEIKPYPGDIQPVRTAVLEAMRELKEQGRHAFGLYLGNGNHRLLVLRSDDLMNSDPGHCDAWRGLDVSVLHRLILQEQMGITPERLRGESNLEYISDFPHALQGASDRVRSGECQALFLLNPTGVAEVRAVAAARERMPQKSTFFYPKVYTGMVFYCMDT